MSACSVISSTAVCLGEILLFQTLYVRHSVHRESNLMSSTNSVASTNLTARALVSRLLVQLMSRDRAACEMAMRTIPFRKFSDSKEL